MPTVIIILVLLITATLMASHLLRAFFYPAPPAMPDVVDGDVSDTLRLFEAALSKHATETLAALLPGLTDPAIRAIESQYGFRLSDDLRALYQWRNGTPPDERVELIPGHRLVPLEEAAEQRDAMRRELATQPLVQRIAYTIFAGHRKTWLTVLHDRCGDGYFYDPARRRRGGSFFYHFAEDRQYRFFPSVANFLAGAAECYNAGIYRGGRRGASAEDHERSFRLWPRYAAQSGA